MGNVKSRVLRLESHIKANPEYNAAHWLAEALANPEEYDNALNAAYVLASSGIIAKPTASSWEQIKARFTGTPSEWSDSQLWFYSLFGIEDDCFEDEESRISLCAMAAILLKLFKEAPLPDMPEVSKFGAGRVPVECKAKLRGKYLIPIFKQAFPELQDGDSLYGRFEDWLDTEPDLSSPDLLSQARAFLGAAV